MKDEFCLEVNGPFACFTRPEMKAERVSYDVITPSAARAIFEAILWKPAIQWQIVRIEVLAPTQWVNIRRNEVGSVVPTGSVRSAMKAGRGNLAQYVEDDRQQRASLLLRDVHYRLYAHLRLTPKAGAEDNPAKFGEMFRRRAAAGQCFNQPYLGCREFAADFRLVTQPASEPAQPIAETHDLGYMLYDLDYNAPGGPSPMLFRAQMVSGRIEVPGPQSHLVKR